MKKSIPRYVWMLCLIGTIFILTIVIPISIYNIYPVELSLFGGFLIGLFLIFYLLYEDVENNNDDERTDEARGAITIGVIVMFVSAFVFSGIFDSKVSYRLRDGIKATGIVVNLEAETNYSRHRWWWFTTNESYYATVEFKTTEGWSVQVTEYLGFEDYSNLRHGSKVDLLYSKKDPNIAALMISADTIKKHVVTAERIIQLNDLFTLLDKPSTQIEAFLNSISYQWLYNENNRRWENARRDISIAVEEGTRVVYRFTIIEREIFEFELRDNGFIEIADGETKGTKYNSEKFIATVGSEVIQSGGHINMYKVVTVTKR